MGCSTSNDIETESDYSSSESDSKNESIDQSKDRDDSNHTKEKKQKKKKDKKKEKKKKHKKKDKKKKMPSDHIRPPPSYGVPGNAFAPGHIGHGVTPVVQPYVPIVQPSYQGNTIYAQQSMNGMTQTATVNVGFI